MKRLAVIILLILGGVVGLSGYLYYRWAQFNNLSPLLNPSGEGGEPLSSLGRGQITNGKIFASNDNSFQFRYPQGWFINPLTANPRTSRTGVVTELWRLTSFKPANLNRSSLPAGSVRIDFEISTNNENKTLEDVVSCGELNIAECREIKVNGFPFKRVISRLPAGGQSIALIAVKNNKIYKATAYPTPGEGEDEAVQQVEAVFNTFRLTD